MAAFGHQGSGQFGQMRITEAVRDAPLLVTDFQGGIPPMLTVALGDAGMGRAR